MALFVRTIRPATRGLVFALAMLLAPALRAETTPLAHVETAGEGPTELILIPGWMCDWTVWNEFMQRNTDRYTMRAVTLPGFVGEDAPEPDEAQRFAETPWINNAIGAVAQLIEDERIEDPIIVGHSLGGQIAMRLAIERPELVGKVVTVDGMPAVPLKYETGIEKGADRAALVEDAYEPWLRAMSSEDWTIQFDSAVDNLVDTTMHRAQLRRMFRATEREHSVRYLVEALKTDITPEVAQIQAPLLAIAAIEDCPQAPAAFEESICAVWHEQIEQAPDAQIVFFEHARHFFFLTMTEDFDKAIEQFAAGDEVVIGWRAPTGAAAGQHGAKGRKP